MHVARPRLPAILVGLVAIGTTPVAIAGRPAADRLEDRIVVAVPPGRGDAFSAWLTSLDRPGAGLSGRVAAWRGGAATPEGSDADLVLPSFVALARGCAAGGLLPAPTRDVRWRPVGRCGMGVAWQAYGLAWDPSRLERAPGWSEFWDVARFPGRRGLYRGARGTLEVALLGDGVPPGALYAVLETEAGARRAFRKLDQLRPYIAWWTDAASPIPLLRRRGVLMTTARAADLRATSGSGAAAWHPAMSTAAGLAEIVALAVPASAPSPDRGRDLAAALAHAAPPSPPYSALGAPPFPIALDEAFWDRNGIRLEARFADWSHER